MTVYIVMYQGVIIGVFDSEEKARSSELADMYDSRIIERVVL